jgi:hypothetical protein
LSLVPPDEDVLSWTLCPCYHPFEAFWLGPRPAWSSRFLRQPQR